MLISPNDIVVQYVYDNGHLRVKHLGALYTLLRVY